LVPRQLRGHWQITAHPSRWHPWDSGSTPHGPDTPGADVGRLGPQHPSFASLLRAAPTRSLAEPGRWQWEEVPAALGSPRQTHPAPQLRGTRRPPAHLTVSAEPSLRRPPSLRQAARRGELPVRARPRREGKLRLGAGSGPLATATLRSRLRRSPRPPTPARGRPPKLVAERARAPRRELRGAATSDRAGARGGGTAPVQAGSHLLPRRPAHSPDAPGPLLTGARLETLRRCPSPEWRAGARRVRGAWHRPRPRRLQAAAGVRRDGQVSRVPAAA
jgi:hypothetical protein